MSANAAPPGAQAIHGPMRMLVQKSPGTDLRHIHQRHGNRVLKEFPELGIEVVEMCGGSELGGMIRKYRCCAEVREAEPDYIVQAESMPNDTAFQSGLLWALNNYGQVGGTAGADMRAPDAWDGVRMATNVIVAVIDTGVRYTHEDLAANIWVNRGEIPGNGMDDDGNGYVDDVHGIDAITGSGDPMDDYGHGTHVAGIIGAAGNNGRGVVGVAWRVQILPLRFMSRAGAGAYSDAIECIEYARKAGAKLVNISWGKPSFSSALYKAISNARAAGMIFIASAGNTARDNDTTPFYPASFGLDNVVSVAATTRWDTLAEDYSNYGAKSVHLAAPGSDIYSTWHTSDQAYTSMTGTSMAAPQVTGLLALMRVRFPGETSQQHLARVIGSSDPLPTLLGKCVSGGRVNMCRALGLPTAGGLGTSLPRLAVTSGAVLPLRLRLNGQAGQPYAIEVSNDLELWTPVLTNTAWSDGSVYFDDPSPRKYPQHFFRARPVSATSENLN